MADDEGFVRTSPTLTMIAEDNAELASYTSNNVPLPITDSTTTYSTITVPDSFNILDVNVQLNITHASDADLSIRLRGPSGQSVPLVLSGGVSGQNFNHTVFDDEADTWIMVGTAHFAGSYRPYGGGGLGGTILSVFDQQDAAGIWTLEVSDGARKNQGTLNSWSIHFTRAITPAPPPMAMTFESSSTADSAGDSSTLPLDAATVDRILTEAEAQNTWTRKSRQRIFV